MPHSYHIYWATLAFYSSGDYVSLVKHAIRIPYNNSKNHLMLFLFFLVSSQFIKIWILFYKQRCFTLTPNIAILVTHQSRIIFLYSNKWLFLLKYRNIVTHKWLIRYLFIYIEVFNPGAQNNWVVALQDKVSQFPFFDIKTWFQLVNCMSTFIR